MGNELGAEKKGVPSSMKLRIPEPYLSNGGLHSNPDNILLTLIQKKHLTEDEDDANEGTGNVVAQINLSWPHFYKFVKLLNDIAERDKEKVVENLAHIISSFTGPVIAKKINNFGMSTATQSERSIASTTITYLQQNIDMDDIIVARGKNLESLKDIIKDAVCSGHGRHMGEYDTSLNIINRIDGEMDGFPKFDEDASKMNIELLQKYLIGETQSIRLEFINDVLRVFTETPEHLLKQEIVKLISEWIETAEICLDESLMKDIEEVEAELKSGSRGKLWLEQENIM